MGSSSVGKWVGSWAWAEHSGGVLGPHEQRALWSLALRGELRRLANRFAARFDEKHLDVERVVMPDSQISLAARQLCATVSTPSLLGHCVRTYIWGALLAQRTQQTYDVELMFVASLLHDLGLTDYAPPNEQAPCFAVSGARAARIFLLNEGVEQERALRAAECISLHMNPYVPAEHSIEAQLMAAGAALDAVGARKHEITPRVRGTVLRRYPPSGFGDELQCCMHDHIAAWPTTRAAFLERNFGFLKRIARRGL
jgi:HD superfamily phosphodiesterase